MVNIIPCVWNVCAMFAQRDDRVMQPFLEYPVYLICKKLLQLVTKFVLYALLSKCKIVKNTISSCPSYGSLKTVDNIGNYSK